MIARGQATGLAPHCIFCDMNGREFFAPSDDGEHVVLRGGIDTHTLEQFDRVSGDGTKESQGFHLAVAGANIRRAGILEAVGYCCHATTLARIRRTRAGLKAGKRLGGKRGFRKPDNGPRGRASFLLDYGFRFSESVLKYFMPIVHIQWDPNL
jgi:hypothetical protein